MTKRWARRMSRAPGWAGSLRSRRTRAPVRCKASSRVRMSPAAAPLPPSQPVRPMQPRRHPTLRHRLRRRHRIHQRRPPWPCRPPAPARLGVGRQADAHAVFEHRRDRRGPQPAALQPVHGARVRGFETRQDLQHAFARGHRLVAARLGHGRPSSRSPTGCPGWGHQRGTRVANERLGGKRGRDRRDAERRLVAVFGIGNRMHPCPWVLQQAVHGLQPTTAPAPPLAAASRPG